MIVLLVLVSRRLVLEVPLLSHAACVVGTAAATLTTTATRTATLSLATVRKSKSQQQPVPIGPRECVPHEVREPVFGHIFGKTTLPVDDFAESLVGRAA